MRTRIYLFLGPETGLKSEEIGQIRKHVTSSGDIEERHFFSFDSSLREVWTYVQTSSLFGAHRFVIFDGAHEIRKKDDLEALAHLSKTIPDDATLILVTTETKVSDKVKKLIPSEHVKIFWEMFDNQKRGWLLSYFRKHGVHIENAAADLMLELVENDTADLRAEAQKLVAMAGHDTTITTEHIESFVYHSKEENSFSLFRKIVSGDFEAALGIVQSLRLSGASNPVAIVAALTWQFSRLDELHSLEKTNHSRAEAFKQLRVTARAAQRDMSDGASRFSAEAVKRVLALLADYDVRFRSGTNRLHAGMLVDLLYGIMIRPPSARATMNRFSAASRWNLSLSPRRMLL